MFFMLIFDDYNAIVQVFPQEKHSTLRFNEEGDISSPPVIRFSSPTYRGWGTSFSSLYILPSLFAAPK